MFFFLLAFDTTVPGGGASDPLGQRSHNLGLLADRICGILVSGFMAVIGTLLSEVAPASPQKPVPPRAQ